MFASMPELEIIKSMLFILQIKCIPYLIQIFIMPCRSFANLSFNLSYLLFVIFYGQFNQCIVYVLSIYSRGKNQNSKKLK